MVTRTKCRAQGHLQSELMGPDLGLAVGLLARGRFLNIGFAHSSEPESTVAPRAALESPSGNSRFGMTAPPQRPPVGGRGPRSGATDQDRSVSSSEKAFLRVPASSPPPFRLPLCRRGLVVFRRPAWLSADLRGKCNSRANWFLRQTLPQPAGPMRHQTRRPELP